MSLAKAVEIVCEGWTLPDDVRKILENALNQHKVFEVEKDAAKWSKLWNMVEEGTAEVTFFGRLDTINTGLLVTDGGGLSEEIDFAMNEDNNT